MTSNVINFPKIFKSDNPTDIAEALVDYVKDKPHAKLLVVIKHDETSTDEEGELTMGWSPMGAAELLLMVKYAEYKWELRTFRDKDSAYVDAD